MNHERPDYRPVADYGLLADCNSAALVDRDGSIEWLCLPRYDSDAVFARILDADAGHWLGFSMCWAPPERREAHEPTPAARVSERIDDTAEARRSWEAEHDIYEGAHRELVRLSSRVLKGLSYRPTGAIVAAPTTSLPETVGGERNQLAGYANDLGLLAEEIDTATGEQLGNSRRPSATSG